MKVTVIATGFQSDGIPYQPRPIHRAFSPPEPLEEEPSQMEEEFDPAPEIAEADTPSTDQDAEVPFYRKVLAHEGGEDPGGFGPNWSEVDDFDIPTVLRKNLD